MNLPNAPAIYDQRDQDQLRGAIDKADKLNVKAGSVFSKILMRDAVTGTVVALTVASGALVIT